MAEELLSLKWNNHQSHFVDILSYLREQEIFIDATIACGGKVYSAHKFVLSTCSEYFKQIFAVNKSTHPIVFMKDVSCKDIEALLDFMYHGEVNVPQSNLGSLIKTAEGLQIKGLAVPDDPPTNKRDRESTNTGSPPAKKLHTDRSPARNRMSGQTNFNVNSRNNNRPPSPDINSSRPEKDKTLINSRSTNSSSIINQSSSNINKGSSISNRHSKEEVDPVDDERGETEPQSQMTSNEEPENDDDAEDHGSVVNAATKQEEMEIKQEEVVDLDDEDPDPTDDWLGPHNNDNSLGSDNNSSSMFPVDLLMHGADNGMGAGTSSGNSNAAGNVAGTSSASDAAMIILCKESEENNCSICWRSISEIYNMDTWVNWEMFLKNHQLVKTEQICMKCGNPCKLMAVKNNHYWSCNRRPQQEDPAAKESRCSVRHSVFKGTWFHNSKLSVATHIIFVKMFLEEDYNSKTTSTILKVNKNTLTDYTNHCREVFVNYCSTHSEPIGGEGVVVQLDEEKSGKRRSSKVGAMESNQWVVGGFDVVTKTGFFIVNQERSRETLLSIIKTWIRPGTTVVSSCWKSFDCFSCEEFHDLRLIGRYNFVARDRKIGCKGESNGQLARSMFLNKFITPGERSHNFWTHVGKMYTVK